VTKVRLPSVTPGIIDAHIHQNVNPEMPGVVSVPLRAGSPLAANLSRSHDDLHDMEGSGKLAENMTTGRGEQMPAYLPTDPLKNLSSEIRKQETMPTKMPEGTGQFNDTQLAKEDEELLKNLSSVIREQETMPTKMSEGTGQFKDKQLADEKEMFKNLSSEIRKEEAMTTETPEGTGQFNDTQLAKEEEEYKHEDIARATSLGPQEATFQGDALRFWNLYDHLKWRLGWLHRHRNEARHEQSSIWRSVLRSSAAGFAIFAINLLDVVWIMPFIISKKNGTWNTVFYLLTCQLVIVISILVVLSRGTLEKRFPSGHMEHFLDILSSVLLTGYAAYLWYEATIAEKETNEQHPLDVSETVEDDPKSSDLKEQSEAERIGQFIILVMLGSLDQIAVYVPLLTAKELNGVELSVAVLVSSAIAIAVCHLLGQATCLVDLVGAVPMWGLVAALAVSSYGWVLGM